LVTGKRTARHCRLFNSAIELDPDFASAYGRAALCYVFAKINGWFSDTANEMAEVKGSLSGRLSWARMTRVALMPPAGGR